MFVSGAGTFGYKSYVVAAINNQVVGIGSFCNGTEFKRRAFATGWQTVKFCGLKQSLPILKRGKQLEKMLPAPGKDTEFFTQIAVVETLRQKGIGTTLLKRQIEIAKTKQRHRCVLDVAVNNPGAQKLYERLGFNVIMETKWHIPNSAIILPNHRRMELLL